MKGAADIARKVLMGMNGSGGQQRQLDVSLCFISFSFTRNTLAIRFLFYGRPDFLL